MRTLLVLALATTALVACSPRDDAAPAVSTSESPRNDAVAADANMEATTQTPGANSFTEGQARDRITGAGYTAVGALTQNAEGLWQGMATGPSGQVQVSVDYRGAVTPPGPSSGANADTAATDSESGSAERSSN